MSPSHVCWVYHLHCHQMIWDMTNYRGETLTSQKVQVSFLIFFEIEKFPLMTKTRKSIKTWANFLCLPVVVRPRCLPTCLFLIGYEKYIITHNWWPYHGLTTSSSNRHVSPLLWLGRLGAYYNLWQGYSHLLPSSEQFGKKRANSRNFG